MSEPPRQARFHIYSTELTCLAIIFIPIFIFTDHTSGLNESSKIHILKC